MREHLLDDVPDVLVLVTLLILLDKPGVLGEPAGVKEDGNIVGVRDFAGRRNIGQGHGLAAAGVIGDGDEYHRDPVAGFLQELLEPGDIDISLEMKIRRVVLEFRREEIEGLYVVGLDVGLRGIEVPVRRVFEEPTIAGLGKIITENLVEQEEADELNELLAELESLSEEDVRNLLHEETP